MLPYGFKCWTMTREDKRSLRLFEQKVLQRVFGIRHCNDITYRIQRYNDDLLNLCRGKDVVKHIKSQKRQRLGHTVRTEDILFNSKLYNDPDPRTFRVNLA